MRPGVQQRFMTRIILYDLTTLIFHLVIEHSPNVQHFCVKVGHTCVFSHLKLHSRFDTDTRPPLLPNTKQAKSAHKGNSTGLNKSYKTVLASASRETVYERFERLRGDCRDKRAQKRWLTLEMQQNGERY